MMPNPGHNIFEATFPGYRNEWTFSVGQHYTTGLGVPLDIKLLNRTYISHVINTSAHKHDLLQIIVEIVVQQIGCPNVGQGSHSNNSNLFWMLSGQSYQCIGRVFALNMRYNRRHILSGVTQTIFPIPIGIYVFPDNRSLTSPVYLDLLLDFKTFINYKNFSKVLL